MRLLLIPKAVLIAACAMPVTHAELLLEDCRISAGPGFPGIKARCGTLARHEDPSDESSEKLLLSVAVVPALSLEPEPDPFLPIAGGPGQSTIEFYSLLSHAFEKIRRSRNIVLLDQRGTGASAKMECNIGDEVIEGHATPGQILDLTEDCLEALPHDPRFFTTSVAVSDLEALRVALDVPQFNVYGASYGSRVAQHYARRYPGSVRTVILDGVVPPQLALGAVIAVEAQNALDRIFDRCAQSPECNERFPDIEDDFASLDERLAAGAVSVDIPNPLTGRAEAVNFGGAELAGAIRLLSYSPRTVALMPLLIHEAANANLSPLASQFLMAMERMSDALAIGMHNAVVCTEDAPFYDGEMIARDELESTYIGAMQIEALETICSVWPTGTIDPEFKMPLASSTPVLLLSGDADPVTPPHFAELAAVDLDNARLLTGVNQGHGQAATGCMPEVMGRFVASASIGEEALDADCLARRSAMPFFVDFSGPRP
ncbi:MAG: alpha/beta hydrolase [Woeseia sp.]